MHVIYIQLVGCVACVISSIALGIWLKGHPSQTAAEKSTRIMHAMLLSIYILPLIIVLLRAELTQYDKGALPVC